MKSRIFILLKLLGILISNFRFLPKTIYVNFHYLPFKQAIKLPIFVYKIKLKDCKGTIKINSLNIKFRMIEIGRDISEVYADTGVIWNHKGRIEFNGRCVIGSSSTIMVGSKGYLEFGDNFMSTTMTKIISFHYIKFNNNIRVGWETIIMDTSHHILKNLEGNYIGDGYGSIVIGESNWISTRSMVVAGTVTPSFCIIGANSYINKDFSMEEEKIFLAGNPCIVKNRGIWMDMGDDMIVNYKMYQDCKVYDDK